MPYIPPPPRPPTPPRPIIPAAPRPNFHMQQQQRFHQQQIQRNQQLHLQQQRFHQQQIQNSQRLHQRLQMDHVRRQQEQVQQLQRQQEMFRRQEQQRLQQQRLHQDQLRRQEEQRRQQQLLRSLNTTNTGSSEGTTVVNVSPGIVLEYNSLQVDSNGAVINPNPTAPQPSPGQQFESPPPYQPFPQPQQQPVVLNPQPGQAYPQPVPQQQHIVFNAQIGGATPLVVTAGQPNGAPAVVQNPVQPVLNGQPNQQAAAKKKRLSAPSEYGIILKDGTQIIIQQEDEILFIGPTGIQMVVNCLPLYVPPEASLGDSTDAIDSNTQQSSADDKSSSPKSPPIRKAKSLTSIAVAEMEISDDERMTKSDDEILDVDDISPKSKKKRSRRSIGNHFSVKVHHKLRPGRSSTDETDSAPVQEKPQESSNEAPPSPQQAPIKDESEASKPLEEPEKVVMKTSPKQPVRMVNSTGSIPEFDEGSDGENNKGGIEVNYLESTATLPKLMRSSGSVSFPQRTSVIQPAAIVTQPSDLVVEEFSTMPVMSEEPNPAANGRTEANDQTDGPGATPIETDPKESPSEASTGEVSADTGVESESPEKQATSAQEQTQQAESDQELPSQPVSDEATNAGDEKIEEASNTQQTPQQPTPDEADKESPASEPTQEQVESQPASDKPAESGASEPTQEKSEPSQSESGPATDKPEDSVTSEATQQQPEAAKDNAVSSPDKDASPETKEQSESSPGKVERRRSTRAPSPEHQFTASLLPDSPTTVNGDYMERSGWLNKLSHRKGMFGDKWQKRYFVLNRSWLYYFKKYGDSNPRGVIRLLPTGWSKAIVQGTQRMSDAVVSTNDKPPGIMSVLRCLAVHRPSNFAASLSTLLDAEGVAEAFKSQTVSVNNPQHASRTFYMTASSNDERDAWVNAVNINIKTYASSSEALTTATKELKSMLRAVKSNTLPKDIPSLLLLLHIKRNKLIKSKTT